MNAFSTSTVRPRRMAPAMPGLGRDPAAVRARIEAMEQVLERAFTIPGLGRKVGLDAVAGLVPVLGDMLTAAMGAWLVWEARNLGLPKWKLWRMSANVAFDAAIGAVPVVGDAFDLLFRSNSRNLKIIRKHLDRHHPASGVIEG
ncbi:DUF4112 domain-containing protein [Novosphingobium percolationis]|uniref:DUF4112 domain-containing protein n=1 Tax=Novosphingobium percolationis TaxID=2871811 RepID=UPI001CD40480|nr:DUF4112 domain-containing protein [Novosphingobium percolationis]